MASEFEAGTSRLVNVRSSADPLSLPGLTTVATVLCGTANADLAMIACELWVSLMFRVMVMQGLAGTARVVRVLGTRYSLVGVLDFVGDRLNYEYDEEDYDWYEGYCC